MFSKQCFVRFHSFMRPLRVEDSKTVSFGSHTPYKSLLEETFYLIMWKTLRFLEVKQTNERTSPSTFLFNTYHAHLVMEPLEKNTAEPMNVPENSHATAVPRERLCQAVQLPTTANMLNVCVCHCSPGNMVSCLAGEQFPVPTEDITNLITLCSPGKMASRSLYQ